MTEVTGTQLRRAIKTWEARRDLAVAQFTPSLTAFPGETEGKDPQVVNTEILHAEGALAKLLVAQGQYNLSVHVNITGQNILLSEAIKRVGGLSRAAKRWKEASSTSTPRHHYRETDPEVRDPEKLYAQRTIPPKDAGELNILAERDAQLLRDAIGSANGTTVNIDLDAGLLD